MNDQQYRLIRGKLHRVSAKSPSGYETIKTNSIFVPTDEELRLHKGNFEGPLTEVTVAAANAVPPSIDERAALDLQLGLPGIRDVVRQADKPYLEALQRMEGRHQPAPRVKVLQMITRRLLNLAS